MASFFIAAGRLLFGGLSTADTSGCLRGGGVRGYGVAGYLCARACGNTIGVALNAIPTGEYGWVAIHGHSLRVNTLAAEGVGVRLFTTDIAGALADATASGSAATIFGLTLVATASGTTASNAACIMQKPVVRKTIVDAYAL